MPGAMVIGSICGLVVAPKSAVFWRCLRVMIAMVVSTWTRSCGDELVVARYAELAQDGSLDRTIRRMKRKDSHFRGNGGGMAFFELLGEDPLADFKERLAKFRKKSGKAK